MLILVIPLALLLCLAANTANNGEWSSKRPDGSSANWSKKMLLDLVYTLTIAYGFPQGSILSPMLFNLYMKSLGEVI